MKRRDFLGTNMMALAGGALVAGNRAQQPSVSRVDGELTETVIRGLSGEKNGG